jgi:hypothetical protein
MDLGGMTREEWLAWRKHIRGLDDEALLALAAEVDAGPPNMRKAFDLDSERERRGLERAPALDLKHPRPNPGWTPEEARFMAADARYAELSGLADNGWATEADQEEIGRLRIEVARAARQLPVSEADSDAEEEARAQEAERAWRRYYAREGEEGGFIEISAPKKRFEQATAIREYRVDFCEHPFPPPEIYPPVPQEKMAWSIWSVELSGVLDVHEAIEWAESHWREYSSYCEAVYQRMYVLYVRAPDGNLVQVAGRAPLNPKLGPDKNLDRPRLLPAEW